MTNLTDHQRAVLDHAAFMAEWFGIFPFRVNGDTKDTCVREGYLQRVVSERGHAYYRITDAGRAALSLEQGEKP